METDLTKAQHYRDMASKMRALAAQENNEAARDTMMSLAAKYEELCFHLLDRTERSGS